jgi:hypothetical protein
VPAIRKPYRAEAPGAREPSLEPSNGGRSTTVFHPNLPIGPGSIVCPVLELDSALPAMASLFGIDPLRKFGSEFSMTGVDPADMKHRVMRRGKRGRI